MDSPVDANRASRERLATFVRGLTDHELTTQIDGGWTVAMALAHLGFWDRLMAERWRAAIAAGAGGPAPLSDALSDLLNDALAAEWKALQGRDSAGMALAAATAVDTLIEGLDEAAMDAGRKSAGPRSVDRSKHRIEHLDDMVRALGQ